MKNLKHFLNESLLLEAGPKFDNSVEGIEAFCDYVYDKNFVKWVINPDLTITISPVNPAPNGVNNLYMHTKDLKEIPDFILYSGIEGITLGLASDSKLKTWEPNVNGVCAGVIVNSDKLVELNLTNCDCVGGKLYVEQCKSIKKIVGGHGDGVQVYIKKNKNLEYLNLKEFKNCLDPGSYVSKNKKLLDTSMIPSEVCID